MVKVLSLETNRVSDACPFSGFANGSLRLTPCYALRTPSRLTIHAREFLRRPEVITLVERQRVERLSGQHRLITPHGVTINVIALR